MQLPGDAGERAAADPDEPLVARRGDVGVDEIELDLLAVGVAEVGDQVGEGTRRAEVAVAELEHVAPGAAGKGVLAEAAVEQVGAVAAVDRVAPAAAADRVVAGEARERVAAVRAAQHVGERVADADARRAGEDQFLDLVGQRVVGAGADRVPPAVGVLDHRVAGGVDPVEVVARAAAQHVVARASVEHVVSVAAVELVGEGVAGQPVGMRRAEEVFDPRQPVAPRAAGILRRGAVEPDRYPRLRRGVGGRIDPVAAIEPVAAAVTPQDGTPGRGGQVVVADRPRTPRPRLWSRRSR